MFFKSLEYIKDLENSINSSYSLPIFKGYIAINKRGVEKIIEELYSALPQDVQNAQEYLEKNEISFDNKEQKDKGIYEYLSRLEKLFDKSFDILNMTIIPSDKAQELINKITESLPKEILSVKKLNKK